MRILHLEDRGSVSHYVKELLEEDERHEVRMAFSISDAQSFWKPQASQQDPRGIGTIDCIIADLNLNPQGLKEEERAETRGGLLTGWIWLRSYVFSEQPQMRKRTVIYSEYVADLRSHVLPADLRDIRIIGKRGASSPLRMLRDAVREIADDLLREQQR